MKEFTKDDIEHSTGGIMNNFVLFGVDYCVDDTIINDEMGSFGRSNASLQKIQIAKDIGLAQKQSTLLHEILHLISFHLRLELTEQQVSGLETGLFEYLITNEHPFVMPKIVTKEVDIRSNNE